MKIKIKLKEMKKRFEWTKYLSKGERWFLWGMVVFESLCLLISIVVIFSSPFTGIATTLIFAMLLYTHFNAPKCVAIQRKHNEEMRNIDAEILADIREMEKDLADYKERS